MLLNLSGLIPGLADPIVDQRHESSGGHAFAAVCKERRAVTSHATHVEVVPQSFDRLLPDDESSSVLCLGLGQRSSAFGPHGAVRLFYHPNSNLASAQANELPRPEPGVDEDPENSLRAAIGSRLGDLSETRDHPDRQVRFPLAVLCSLAPKFRRLGSFSGLPGSDRSP